MESGQGPSKQPKNNGKSIAKATSKKGKGNQKGQEPVYVPWANVLRIMSQALPEHAIITDDAKEMIQKCVSEFISFITTEANKNCQNDSRKTVSAEDILRTLESCGFDEYVPPLATYINKMRNEAGSRRSSFVPRLVGSTSAQGGHNPVNPEIGHPGHNPVNPEIGSDDESSVLDDGPSTVDASDDQFKVSNNNGK